MNAIATFEVPPAELQTVQDDALYEIVNGQKVEVPPMSVYATWIASRLARRLGSFAEAHGLGAAVVECLFILDAVRNQRRRPDVAFVSAATWPLDRLIPETGDWETVPDLAVEVISPNEYFQEVLVKMHEYFSYGVRQVWFVVPATQEIYVYDSPTAPRVFTATDEMDCAPLLPGLRLAVGSLFQRQPQPSSDGR
jgi:Uma2 family endonuclease